MATAKKHRGLGRGLDALIPMAEPQESETENHAESSTGTEKEREEVLAGQKKTETDRENRTSGEEKYVRMVKLSLVEPDKSQPRKKFDSEKLEELAESIRNKGLLEPILVQDKGDHYEIIAGERRWRACRMAQLHEIPVIVKNYDEQERIEISLIENIQREDLNPIEEARAYKRLTEEFHLKQDEVAQKVSKNRTSIANSMRLLKLADPVQKMVVDGSISMGHARALIPVEEEKIQTQLAQKIVSENLSVRDTEKLVRSLQEQKNTTAGKETAGDASLNLIYQDIADKMNATLGMKVRIRQQSGKSGKLEISFAGQEDLEKLMDLLITQN